VILCDVNVLVCAHKEGADRHDEYRAWLEEAMNGDEAFGVSDLVLSSVLRIVTHPRVFDPPSSWYRAREFADSVRSAPNAVPVAPGPRHWQIFTELGGRSKRSWQPRTGRLPSVARYDRVYASHPRLRSSGRRSMIFTA